MDELTLTSTCLYPCEHRCPGGNKCCCDPEFRHGLHICSDPRCFCHSKERYDTERFFIGKEGAKEESNEGEEAHNF